jgi:hypothetical protein
MNIQISGLPDNQKIKSINFNIVFDDSNIESTSHTNINVQKPKYSVETIETKPVQQEHQEVQKEIPKPSDIDISKREPKIDPNMLDEVF